MNPTETYLFLFTDSFITGLVLPVRNDLVFTAMRLFGGYNLYLATLISTIAITLASCANFGLGLLLRSLKKYDPNKKENPKADKILKILQTHSYWAAILGFIPILGPFLIVFTGLVQTRFIKVVTLVFIVNLLSHAAYIL